MQYFVDNNVDERRSAWNSLNAGALCMSHPLCRPQNKRTIETFHCHLCWARSYAGFIHDLTNTQTHKHHVRSFARSIKTHVTSVCM